MKYLKTIYVNSQDCTPHPEEKTDEELVYEMNKIISDLGESIKRDEQRMNKGLHLNIN